MTTHPKPARVDLGDGDSLILFRTDDWHTTVRFHSANPNTSLAGAVMATAALRDALDEIAPGQEAEDEQSGSDFWCERWAEAACQRDDAQAYAALWKETARRAVQDERRAARTVEAVARASDHIVGQRDAAERRAEKAEQERDEALARVDRVTDRWQTAAAREAELASMTAREHLDAAWEAARVPADGIIPKGAEYVERYGDGSFYGPLTSGGGLRADRGVLERRLLDPPAPSRPEGAEFWESVVADQVGGDLAPDAIRTLADTIAQRSARVTGAES